MLFENLGIKKGITAFVGSGGKTSLILALAKELSEKNRVIITTTTKILPPEGLLLVTDAEEKSVVQAFEQVNCVVVCEWCDKPGMAKKRLCQPSTDANGMVDTVDMLDGKLCQPNIDFAILKKLADYVLVEADGSRQLPLKAHAEHEPVIPLETNMVVNVIGADGFGRPIDEVCHRPDIYCKILNEVEANGGVYTPEMQVTPAMAAVVVARENYGDFFVINHVDNEERKAYAEKFEAQLQSLKGSDVRCLKIDIPFGEGRC